VLRFVNQHYAPDVASTGQHLTDLAEYLAGIGIPVEILTARGHYAGGRLDAPAREVRRGVQVRRLWTLGLGRRFRLGRILDYTCFYVQAAWATWIGRAPGATIFLTTPPLLGVVGWIGWRLRGRRYGIWSMDLHPDAEIAAGMLRARGPTARALGWLNDRAYRAAEVVIGLGPYMARRILAKGVAPDRLHTVPVWGQEEASGSVAGPGLRAALGLAGKWIVMYSGNAGIVHDFGDVLEAMRQLRDDPAIFFLFVGGGPRRRAIQDYARRHTITNFIYHPYMPRERLAEALGAADVHLITLRAPFAGIAVPGKLYGIMAAGRPALFVGPAGCETADAIRRAGCGVVIDPTESDEQGGAAARIVSAIRAWQADPAAARAAAARGRAAYVTEYARDTNCAMFLDVLGRAWPDLVPRAVERRSGARRRAAGSVAADSQCAVGASVA